MKITSHTLVKNEENYLWFAVMSVIEHVDKVLLWDTGSTDNTVKIIKWLEKRYPKKIVYKQVGDVDINEFTSVRQQMLDATDSDWFVIVDGDEVWWDDSIGELLELIREKGGTLDTVVTRYKNIVGDIFHYQDESAGNYVIDDKKGHLTIRAMNRNIPGLHLAKPHGTQGFFNGDGVLVQEMDKKRRLHMNGEYLHFTHMRRSGSGDTLVPKREMKLKYEIGRDFPLDFYYPEVFFKKLPDYVSCPWHVMSDTFKNKAMLQTPLRKIKRQFVSAEVGY